MNKNNITPAQIRKLNIVELNHLAQEIRERIIEVTSMRGGHLAPSLGVVELTIALHYVFDTPNDKIIWDVGHQAYAHKLITGRWDKFETLRTRHGIAGFPKRNESEYDTFDTGHSGNSISVALGIATATMLKGEQRKSIAVIGDGSIVTGMAFEALNYAGDRHQNLIVVLNDNEMSIGKSTGAMARYFSRMITGRMYNRLKTDTWNLLGILPKRLSARARFAARKLEEGLKNLIAPSIIFEEMGFRYLGPFDGHNIELLINTFKRSKNLKGPVLLHIVTKKGKGFEPAEKDPEIYHGIGPFKIDWKLETQNTISTNCCDVFGKTLIKLAEKDSRICAISAGMCLGTGLAEFKQKFPDRFFDVGICEQHAVTFAAGLALSGYRPVVAIYSSFLARAYDQIIQDVALQNLPVVFAIDRAGIVGEDGSTHHGSYDVSFLRCVPNLVIAAPKDTQELTAMLDFAVKQNNPFAIRYPRGSLNSCTGYQISENNRIETGKAEIIYKNILNSNKSKLVILAIGSMVINCYESIQSLLSSENKYKESIKTGNSFLCDSRSSHKNNDKFDDGNIILINMRFIKPFDEGLLKEVIKNDDIVLTVEENTLPGGFGSGVLEFISNNEIRVRKVLRLGLEDKFIEHGKRDELLDQNELSVLKLTDKIKRIIKNDYTD